MAGKITGADILNNYYNGSRNSSSSKDEKDEQDKKKITGADILKGADNIRKYKTTDTSSVDQKYIGTFLTDAKNFLSSAEKDLGSVGWGNASSSFDSRNAIWQDLSARADTIGAWLYKNKGGIKDEDYQSLAGTLDDFRTSGSSVLDSFGRERDYYAQWESEDAYNNWYAEEQRKEEEKKAITGAADFEANKGYISTKETPDNIWEKLFDNSTYGLGYDDLTYEYINNQGGLRDEIDRKYAMYSADTSSQDGESTYKQKGYAHLEEDEVGIYNYLYATQGKEKAQAYLDSLEPTLVQRKAGKEFERLEGNTLAEIFYGFAAGADQFASGIKNLGSFVTGGEGFTPSSQYVSGMIREDLADNGAKLPDWMGGASIGQIGYDMANTTANMLPSILVGSVTGGLGGALTLGASSMGNAYNEMRSLGYDEWQARGYGLLVGASETLLSYALGGISKLGGKVSGNAVSKLVSKIDNALAKTAITLGGKMISEGLEESIQTALEPAFKALMTGEDFESPEWDEILYSGLLGALSAGLMEGGGTIAGEVSTYKQGKVLKDMGAEGVDKLVGIGKTLPTGSTANRLANKVNEKTGAYTVGRLLNEVGTSLSEQNKADISKALVEKGMREKDASAVAKWLGKALDGGYFTKKQTTTLESSENIASVYKDVILDPNSALNKSIQEYNNIRNEAQNPTAKPTDEAQNPTEAKLADEEIIKKIAEVTGEDADVLIQNYKRRTEGAASASSEKAKATSFKTSESGKTMLIPTDGEAEAREVSIKEIASINNGEITLRLEDGRTVSAKDVELGSDTEELLYGNVVHMGLNAATANAFVKGFDPSEGLSAEMYAGGFAEAYRYGTYGIPMSEMSRNGFSEELTEAQRTLAYNLGKTDAKYKFAPKPSKTASTVTVNAEKGASKGKKGKLHNTIAPKNGRQRASLKALGVVAEALGIDIHIFESEEVNGKRQYTMPDGTVTGANGWFDKKDNSIHIDLYAGRNGKGTMLFTASHELTHFIRQWSPDKFKTFADFLFEQYGEKGVSVDELIKKQIAKAAKKGRVISYDTAYEEVVADACEMMLTDSDAMEKIAELKAKDKSLWEKIKEFITKLVERIKAAYEGLDPDSEEANYVREMKEAAEKLQALWTEALLDAGENYQSIGARDMADFAEAKTTDGELLFQYRAMEADEETYRQMLRKWGKMSEAQIVNLFDTIDTAMEIIEDNLEALDYAWEADIDDRAFSPVKPNSDKLYKVSLDYSTLCRKRILQQTVQAQLQEALNKPLSREEGIAIRDALIALQKEGRQIEVACALCYVESARMKSPEQIRRFMEDREQVIKEYFAGKSGGSIKEKIKQAETDTREKLHKENADGILGKDDTTMLDPRTAALKQLPSKYAEEIREAKREARASYKPTAKEQEIIDTAMGMTVADFTSPEGLENLAKHHPELFDAYTSYVRNATKSKGIENDTWWRAGDSAQIGDTLIANMNKENGLRSQSWSDFQVIHILDYIASTIELATRETKEQAYTKVPDYAELMGNTGVMINLSLIPTAKFNGSLEYDSVEGIDYKRSLELRDKYHATVGTICIGIDNKQIQMLLADSTIDYVIPYHKSGMSAAVRKLMHIPTWSQYESYQSEKNLSRADAEAQAKKYGVKLLDASNPDYQKGTSFSEWFDIEEARQIASIENANPTDKAKQKKYGKMYGGYMAMQNAAGNYLKLCAERGIAPKFSHEKADFTIEENYWKLLIDRKMVDNVTGEVIEQRTIKPIFDEGEILRILNDELERYPKVKADQDYATRKVTEAYLSGELKGGMSASDIAKIMQKPMDNVTTTNILASAKDVMYSDREDFSYETLISKPDMPLTVIDGNVPGNRADILAEAKKNATKVGKFNPKDGSVSVYVKDIGGDVILGKDGLKHSLDRRMSENSPVVVKAGEIISNSIQINKLLPRKDEIDESYVLIGAAKDADGELYVVRSVVNRMSNELTSIDVLYAVNAKKENRLRSMRPRFQHLVTDSTISISQLLDFVNTSFPDILPESVLKHFGYTERPKGKLGESMLFQERDPDFFTDRSLLAEALESAAQNDIERNKLAEYKKKITFMGAEQKKLSDLRRKIKELSFAKGHRDVAEIKKLQLEAKQTENRIDTYDRQLLSLEATAPLKAVLEREKVQAQKRAEQRSREALEEYKEREIKEHQEFIKRYRESRKAGIESRKKTSVRHKIKGVVDELNQYLLKGTKSKHVPIELQKAVAEALDAVNMDTVNAEERIAAKRAEMLRAKVPETIERLAREIETIREMGGNMAKKISRLKTAYDSIISSDDPLIAGSHDEVISSTIGKVLEVVGDTTLRDMSLYQLEAVYDMYKMVLHSIRAANKAFKAKKSEEISVIANRVLSEMDGLKKKKKLQTKAGQAISEFDWNNQKPIYAFERIGSGTFTEVFENVRAGEDTWAADMSDAQAFREEQYKKHRYSKWDFNKKHKFTSATGNDFELTLGQIMSLYAYSKRGEQATEHLRKGGFVFDGLTEVKEKTKLGTTKTLQLKDSTAYNLSETTLGEIISKLTPEQTAFVDAMQTYLSDVMGEKGNEVSLELYGVKLFKEKNYFPLKSDEHYLARAREQANGDPKIKNKGFTKDVTPGSSNPIVLTPFMDVWADHVNEMSMYHAFTLAMEDFYRVYGYKTPAADNMESVSVVSFLENAHGKAATKYIDQLLKDLNGGARSDSRENIAKKAMSNFKRASVMASLSVVIQQPSAIVRAQALVDAKHFIGKKVSKAKHKELWAEVKKYAPVAIIKEMGYFDVGMGKSSTEWLKGEKTWKDKMDDALSLAPAKADEYTWCAIWQAVKRETLRKNPKLTPTTEEFLKMAGERFTEVITKTQVYDSTLSRSANMRSKSAFMNMLTAFMAEPTTSINMLQEALGKGKGIKHKARVMGAVYGSVLLNSALVSIIYAMRDDDEDETFKEKYLSRLTTEMVDGLNPLTYIPFVKDIWSAAQGFDIERADMTLITSLFDSMQGLINVAGKDTADMDDDEKKEHGKEVTEAILSIVDNVSSLTGLPVKNVRRDIKGIINGITTIMTDAEGRPTTGTSLGDSILGEVQSSIPIWGWFPGKSKADKVYNAIDKGDQAYTDRLKDTYKDEQAFNTSFANHIQKMYKAGTISKERAVSVLVSHGGKTKEDAASKVQYWEFKKQYPKFDLSEEAVAKYYSDIEPVGIGIDTYYDYYTRKANAKGTDTNGDGKTDSGSKKAEVMNIINSLPISRAQKDALYFANGWAASTLHEAPWH